MRINNEIYRMAHGKYPKGYGYWVFEIAGIDKMGNTIVDTLTGIGNLSSARKSACELFGRLYEPSSITEVITQS